MNDIIVALISGGCAIIANQLLTRRTLQEQEVVQAKLMQSMQDKITFLEKEVEENKAVKNKLNNIENIVIALQKDLQYLKENK